MPGRHDRVARPGTCQAPEFPAPSIVDYRPRTTLVTEEHLVPKAKFPVIDSHNHTTITAENIDQMIEEMDALNLRVLVNLSGGADPAPVKTEGRLHPELEVPGSLPRVRQRATGTARAGRDGPRRRWPISSRR